MMSEKIVFLLLKLSFGAYVCCYELPKRRHVHYTFEHLRESVGSDSLSTDDVSRLFIKLHFLNCSENKQTEDYRKCFSPTELYNFSGYSVPKAINATEFLKFAPLLVYCLLPAPERNSGRVPCDAPKNHSALFDSFVKNFSKDGEVGITHEALDKILEDVNKTIGVFLSKSKCFSAENVFQEVHGGEHEGEHKDECAHEEEHAHEEEPHDEEEEEQDEEHSHDEHEEEEVLDQEDFRKACASIIFHLVQGFCIEEGHEHNESSHSTLPSKEFFINDIFKDETHLSEEKLEEIFHSLGIGKSESSESGGGSHEGHDHRRKRSVRQEHSQQDGLSLSSHKVYRRATGHDHGPQENGASNATCYSVDELLTVFDVDHSVGADKFDFKELCPALIQQVRSGACIESTVETHEEDKDMGKIWGYGFAAVTIISLTSLVGVATIPFVGKKMYKKILALLVALAVGTLTGDSILHLLPHAFGLHGHDESESGGEHAHENEDTGFILKALVVMVSIYAFFLFETLMHLCLKSKLHEHGGHSHIDDELPGPSNCHISFKKKQSCPIFEHRQVPPLGKTEEKPAVENGDIVLTNMGSPTRTCTNPTDALNGHCLYEYISSTDTEDEPVKTVVSIDHTVLPPHSESIPKKTLKQSLSKRSVFGDEELAHANPLKKISSVAWMIIIGDTLHNISDGLAIGAAFSEGGSLGVSGGISTSIAVFCHELPHELGDFAVLLTAGMSIKMALLANLLSALSCYIGLAIGIYLGQSADVRFWIFAIAAGMFLYVALVDMLPDLMHSESLQTDPVPTFLYQNLGLVVGICIMLVIALYEEELMAIEF